MSRVKNTPAFRARLQELLHARNLTPSGLQDLAAKKEIKIPDKRTLNRWINGETKSINESSLTPIAEVLDIPYPQLREKLGLTQKRIPWSWLISISVVVGLILTGVFLGKRRMKTPTTNSAISYLKLEDETRILLMDEGGEEQRVINVGAKTAKPLLMDVDGKQYIVAGIREQNPSLDVAGHVIAYDVSGEEKWRFHTHDADDAEFLKPSDLSQGEFPRTYSGYFVVDWLVGGIFFGEGKEYIVVLASDPDYAPTRVTILEPSTGTDVYTFWNSGAINNGDIHDTGMKLHDLNNDGSAEILISGPLNILTAHINRELTLPLDSAFWTASWMLEPTKGDMVCAPKMGLPKSCPQESFKWLAFSHPITTIPSIDRVTIAEGIPGVKIGNSKLGLYHIITYEGDVSRSPGSRWSDFHGKAAPPPLILLKVTDHGLKADLWSEYQVDFEETMRRIYNEQEVQRAQAFLRMYNYEGF